MSHWENAADFLYASSLFRIFTQHPYTWFIFVISLQGNFLIYHHHLGLTTYLELNFLQNDNCDILKVTESKKTNQKFFFCSGILWGSYNRGQIAASQQSKFYLVRNHAAAAIQAQKSVSRLRVAGKHNSQDIQIISKCYILVERLSNFHWLTANI